MDDTWNLWKAKLAEFGKWRLRRKSILVHLYDWYLFKQLLEMIPAEIKGTVLEVGCGSGAILRAIVRISLTTAIGVDPILETSLHPFIQKVREENLNDLHPILAVGESLPIRNESIEFCVVAEALDHMANSKRSLTEIERVLTKNGQLLVVQTVHRYSSASGDPQHLRTYTEESLDEELKEEFTVVMKRNFAKQLLKFPLSVFFNLGRKYYIKCSDREFDTTDAPHGELAVLCRKS